MRWTDLRRAAGLLLLLSAVLSGCARDHVIEVAEKTTPTPIPLALRGQNTLFRLSFPQQEQAVEPGQFQKDEICYLTVGSFRIDCFPDGSSLNLGPNDSTDLLTDLPLWNFQAARNDKAATQSLRLYSLLALIGGSVDRLPGALADYIQAPGQHLDEAIAVAQVLLHEKQVQFQGYARGGSFTISVELTDAGQDKLMDALDEAGEPHGTALWADFPHNPRPFGINQPCGK